jgi:hypothetical protein
VKNTPGESAILGQINNDAPVRASSEIRVQTDRTNVWKLLSGINRWPVWNKTITAAKLEGDLAPSSVFKWKSNGISITSTLQLVEAETKLAWTGRAAGMTAIHVWELHDHEDGGTLVKTSESMEGFLAKWVMSSAKLERSLNDWLGALKNAAEGG